MSACWGLKYQERLKICGLTTLEQRRTRGDLIQTFKLVTGRDEVKGNKFFELTRHRGTRGHNLKLYKPSVGPWKQKFFSARAIDNRNRLDEKTVSAESVNSVKARLDEKYGY